MIKKLIGALACTGVLVLQAYYAQAGNNPSQNGTSKVAVLVNLGDTGELGSSLNKDLALAKSNYERLGYKVVILTNDTDNPNQYATRDNLKREIQKLNGVSELKLDMIGHGTLVDASKIPADQKHRFPTVQYSAEEKKAGSPFVQNFNDQVWVGISISNNIREYENEKGKYAEETKLRESIGAGDFKEILKEFQSKNKDAKTTVHMLNCFGGCVGTEVQGIPNVQIFTAAERSKTAIQFQDPKTPPAKGGNMQDQLASSTNYYKMFQRELAKQKASGEGPSYNSVHFKTALDMFNALVPEGQLPQGTCDLPRSSAQHYLQNWCNTHESSATPKPVSDAVCNCKVDALFKTLREVKDNASLLNKIALPDIVRDVNNISSIAYSRLNKIHADICSNPAMEDKDGALKKAQDEAFKKSKDVALNNMISTVKNDLVRLNKVLHTDSPEGKDAKESYQKYSKIMQELNKPRREKGLKPYRSVADVSEEDARKSGVQNAWRGFQADWHQAKDKFPDLKNEESRIRTHVVGLVQRMYDEAQAYPMEDRIIKGMRKSLHNLNHYFDLNEMILETQASLCFLDESDPGCSTLPEERKIKKPDPSSDEFKSLRTEKVQSLMNMGQNIASPPNIPGQDIFMACRMNPSGDGSGAGGPEGPDGPGSPGAPPSGSDTKSPGKGKQRKNPSAPPPKPPATAQSIYKENLDLLGCFERASQKNPYSAAEVLMNAGSTLQDPSGKCPYVKANADLYKKDLECGQRFSEQADEKSVTEFLNTLRMGDSAP